MAGDPQMFIKVAANIEELKAAMAAAREEVKKTRETTEGFGDAFASRFEHLGERMAEFFAIREMTHFVEEILSGAHALEVLSLQTGIDVESLQVLGAATAEFGLDSEKLGTMIFQLSRRIAGGDQSAATALHMMGLTLEEVRDMKGEELFLTVARGLNTLQGSAVDLAATDLFGGRAGKSVIAFSKDVDGAMAGVKGSVSIASEQSVKDLAAMEVQITRMTTSFHNWATQVLGEVAQGFNVLKDANTQGASKWEIFTAMVKDWAASNSVTGASTSHLTDLLLQYNVAAKDSATETHNAAAAHREVTTVLDARAQAEKFMASVRLDNAQPILDWQRQDLDQLKQMGALTAKNAEAIGVSAEQFKLYEEGLKAATKAEADFNAQEMAHFTTTTKVMQDATKARLANYSFAGQIDALNQLDAAEKDLARDVFNSLTSEKDRAKVIEETTKRHLELMAEEMKLQREHAAVVNTAVLAEFDAQVKLNAEYGRSADGTLKVTSAAKTLSDALAELHSRRVEGISQEKQEQVLMDAYTQTLYDEAVAQDKVNEELAKVPPKADSANQSMKQFTNTLVLGIDNLDDLNKALSDFYDQFAGNSVGTPGGGNVGIPAPQGMPRVRGAVHRESGGPVFAGQPTIVGERRAEVFVPPSNGMIYPDTSSMGNVTVHLTINGNVLGSEQKLQQMISDAVINAYRNTGRRLPTRTQ